MPEQPTNVLFPIVLRVEGSVIVSRRVQLVKEAILMVVNPSGNFTEERFLQR